METIPVQPRDPEKRAITRALRVALLASLLLAVVLLALLATASGNTHLFEGQYPLLLGLAGAVELAQAGARVVISGREAPKLAGATA